MFTLVDGPYNLEDVMLTEETFIASIKHLVHHLVHIGYQVYLAIYGNTLKANETVINEFQVPIILDIVHTFIARLKYRH